jgi:hypothetical protein
MMTLDRPQNEHNIHAKSETWIPREDLDRETNEFRE